MKNPREGKVGPRSVDEDGEVWKFRDLQVEWTVEDTTGDLGE